jgi:hypothetical protein
MRDVLRAVAMTVWPRFKASRAISCPKPPEAAVMNQTGEDILMFMDAEVLIWL